jgi:hypothetical protein
VRLLRDYWASLTLAGALLVIAPIAVAIHDGVPKRLLVWMQALADPYKSAVDVLVVVGSFVTAFATIALAIATFLLAVFGYGSLRAATALAAGEDIRQQKGLAPMLTIEPIKTGAEVTGLEVRNVGIGPAQSIVLAVRGNAPNVGASDVRMYVPRTFLEPGGDVRWEIRFSDRSEFGHAKSIPWYELQLSAVVSYFDLSSNEYRTATSDAIQPAELIWIRPSRLYPERSGLEQMLDKWKTLDELLEYLVPSGPMATTV